MWAPARFGLYVLFDLCGERGTAHPRTSCMSVCGESVMQEPSRLLRHDFTSVGATSAIGGRDGGASDERVAQAAGRCAFTAAALCAP